MAPSDEKKLLSAVLKRLDGANGTFLTGIWPRVVLWVVTALFFMLLFQLGKGYRTGPLVLAIGSAFLGMFVAWVSFAVASTTQWHVMCKHINRQSVEVRLGELET